MMADRRDPKGRFREAHPAEAIIDVLRQKHERAALAIGLVHPTPSPSTSVDQQTIDRELRR
jgi:hypothetical protein